MAADAWTLFNSAKHKIGNGDIDLSSGVFRMSLHRTSASANVVGAISVFSSVGDECAGGGYVATTLNGTQWAAGTSAGQQKWDNTDPVITASASALSAVRYAVIRQSSDSTTSGFLLCYAALSTTDFDVTTGQTLTVQFNATGVFTLA